MSLPFKYKKGIEVKSIVTGYKGLVIARIDYLTGCNNYVVQAPVDKDGKVPEREQFDENTIEQTGVGISDRYNEDGSPVTQDKEEQKVANKTKRSEPGGYQQPIKTPNKI